MRNLNRCKDCFYLIQEYHIEMGKNDNLQICLDRWCLINQVFKRLDGFCDMWEEK